MKELRELIEIIQKREEEKIEYVLKVEKVTSTEVEVASDINVVTPEEIHEVINKNIEGMFITKEGDVYVAADNSTGDCWVEESKDKELLVKWLLGKIDTQELYEVQGKEAEFCWDCKNKIERYCYSPTIYFLDGSKQNIEEILEDMTEEDMKAYEEEIKKEYDNVDYVGLGEFCPHCLACM